jgi:hypothetical protein
MRALPLVCVVFAALLATGAPATNVAIDDSEARAAVAILQKLQQHVTPAQGDWARLFATRGYQRLKEREAAFKNSFTDDQFKAFLSDPAEVAQTDALAKTLDAWTSASLSDMEARARAYLPPNSKLRATVYPLIKPRKNSFVYKLETDPAIMLYLNPSVTGPQFTNTVSHELLHVGDSENCPPPDVATQEKSFNQRQKDYLEWLSAFGEGWAVLAAAPGPDVHPHNEDPPKDRAVWDAAMREFPQDFQSLETFFTQVADGTLVGDAIANKGMTYFGEVQGPWYTVGYKMDVTIERELGRRVLVDALCDKRKYFRTYNEAAQKAGSGLPLWPEKLVDFLR